MDNNSLKLLSVGPILIIENEKNNYKGLKGEMGDYFDDNNFLIEIFRSVVISKVSLESIKIFLYTLTTSRDVVDKCFKHLEIEEKNRLI